MRKRWIAAAALALILTGTPPLARAWMETSRARNTEAVRTLSVEVPQAEEPEEELLPVETAEPAESLTDLRSIPVPDVPEPWQDAARYALYRELLPAGENGQFNGEEPVSRAEAVMALYRLSGILVRVDACPYPDVPEEYQDAVAWAVSVGVSGGVSEDCFDPASPVTRNQLAVMLRRFAAWRGEDTACPAALFPEDEPVPSYTQEAWSWVLDRGLFTGLTENGLYPDLPVSRLQLAGILTRLQADRDPLARTLSLPEGGAVSLSQVNHAALDQAVRSAAQRHGAVGVQVAVVERGAVTDTYSYGWAVKGSEPMTDRRKMRVASLSKVVVGLSAALLEEEGVVDYDENIGTYWGVTPRKPVTIRSMLTHTSTLLNSESLAWDHAGVRDQLVSAYGYSGGAPGDLNCWSYNNHAFGILGQTLEVASGRYLDDVLRERVLDFVGADSAFAGGELEEPELITPLYRNHSLGRSAASMQRITHWNAPGASGRHFAGGFTSSAKDLAKLTALLAGDGCFEGVRLMEAGSVERMESHSDRPLADGTYQAMPMRLRQDIYGREQLYYHTGSAYGVYNLLSYDPLTGDGVVVLTMGADGSRDARGIYAVCGEIAQAVYETIQETTQ